jgi:hypothetical protein
MFRLLIALQVLSLGRKLKETEKVEAETSGIAVSGNALKHRVKHWTMGTIPQDPPNQRLSYLEEIQSIKASNHNPFEP